MPRSPRRPLWPGRYGRLSVPYRMKRKASPEPPVRAPFPSAKLPFPVHRINGKRGPSPEESGTEPAFLPNPACSVQETGECIYSTRTVCSINWSRRAAETPPHHLTELHSLQIQDRQRNRLQIVLAGQLRMRVRVNQYGKGLPILRLGIGFDRLDVLHGLGTPRGVKDDQHPAPGKFRQLPHVLPPVIHPCGFLLFGGGRRQYLSGRVKIPLQRTRSGLLLRIAGTPVIGIVAAGQCGQQQPADHYKRSLPHHGGKYARERRICKTEPFHQDSAFSRLP